MPKPILCIGALTRDTIFRVEALPVTAGKIIPIEAREVSEGMAAAQATSIVRLGGQAALWASTGADALGDTLVRDISGEGVDTTNVRRLPGARSAFSTILMDKTGNTIIVPQYDDTLTAPPDAVPDFTQFSAIMCDVRWPAAAEIALSAAKALGIPGILDLDVGPKDVPHKLIPLASHVVASERGSKLATGKEPEAAAQELGVVTMGERGCWWRDGTTVRHAAAPAVKAIDTLSAGDVFHAGFAIGLVEGWPMERIIAFASMAAAIKCTRFGGRLGCPTRAEVEAKL